MSRPKDLNLPIPAAQIALQNAIESASRIPNSPEIHKLLKRKAELELRQKCVENRRQHLDVSFIYLFFSFLIYWISIIYIFLNILQ